MPVARIIGRLKNDPDGEQTGHDDRRGEHASYTRGDRSSNDADDRKQEDAQREEMKRTRIE